MDKPIPVINKKPGDHKRSGKWPTLRKKFLKGKSCAVCGGKKKLEAHHIKPFHLYPEGELEISNLIALCENSKILNCHFFAGHLGSYRSYNLLVIQDAAEWNRKIKGRP